MQQLKDWYRNTRGRGTDEQIKATQKCGICLDNFDESSLDTTALNCDPKVPHIFHTACLKEALIINPACPLCRKPTQPLRDILEKHNPLSNKKRELLIIYTLGQLASLAGILGTSKLIAFLMKDPRMNGELKQVFNFNLKNLVVIAAIGYCLNRYCIPSRVPNHSLIRVPVSLAAQFGFLLFNASRIQRLNHPAQL